jgi:PAS domain S-box-containing protein
MDPEKLFLRSFIDNANDAFFVTGLRNGNKYGRFIEVNKVLCDRLGYSRKELIDLDPYQIYPSNEQEHIDQAIARLLAGKNPVFEANLVGRKHRLLPVEISLSFQDTPDGPVIIGIARDITERKIVQRRQENFSRQLRNLASRLQNIREDERTVIAREIHDDLGQNLTALKIQTALLCDRTPEIQQDAQPLMILIDQIVERVQKISAKLRPGLLDELGLVPAIEWQSQDFQKHTGIKCDCRLPEEDVYIGNEKATAVFRIFQEALTNVARHAHATHVSINFSLEGNCLILEVTDNGIGISDAQIGNVKSLGLLGMKERALIFGGDLIIRGVAGKGTNLKLKIPTGNQEGNIT